MPARGEGGGFRVRGWLTGKGWVDVQARQKAFEDHGWIDDQDVAVLAALEARETFDRIEVLDRAGEVVATVERTRAALPDRGVVSAPALAFLAAALRLEVAAKEGEKVSDQGRGRSGRIVSVARIVACGGAPGRDRAGSRGRMLRGPGRLRAPHARVRVPPAKGSGGWQCVAGCKRRAGRDPA